MITKCVVACTNAEGNPDFYYCKVKCTKAEYVGEAHRRKAKEAAIRDGYKPFVVYGELDGRDWLFSHFCWATAKIEVTKEMQEAEHMLHQFVRLVDAVQRVQDWKGTAVGDMIAAVQPFLTSPE